MKLLCSRYTLNRSKRPDKTITLKKCHDFYFLWQLVYFAIHQPYEPSWPSTRCFGRLKCLIQQALLEETKEKLDTFATCKPRMLKIILSESSNKVGCLKSCIHLVESGNWTWLLLVACFTLSTCMTFQSKFPDWRYTGFLVHAPCPLPIISI